MVYTTVHSELGVCECAREHDGSIKVVVVTALVLVLPHPWTLCLHGFHGVVGASTVPAMPVQRQACPTHDEVIRSCWRHTSNDSAVGQWHAPVHVGTHKSVLHNNAWGASMLGKASRPTQQRGWEA